MSKVFIDCGARRGESLECYVSKHDLIGADYHLFEANPACYDALDEFARNNPGYNCIVHKCAVWTADEIMNFYVSVDKWGDAGCTIMPEKKEKLDLEHPVKVRTIDFSRFLKGLTKEDYVIVKMDIEGAELRVIPHLIETGAINLIDELLVEWHHNFYPEIDYASIMAQLNATRIKHSRWLF